MDNQSRRSFHQSLFKERECWGWGIPKTKLSSFLQRPQISASVPKARFPLLLCQGSPFGPVFGPDPSSLSHILFASLWQTRYCELVLLPEHQCGTLRDVLSGSSLCCCGGTSMQVCLKHQLAVAKGGVSLAARWVHNVPHM